MRDASGAEGSADVRFAPKVHVVARIGSRSRPELFDFMREDTKFAQFRRRAQEVRDFLFLPRLCLHWNVKCKLWHRDPLSRHRRQHQTHDRYCACLFPLSMPAETYTGFLCQARCRWSANFALPVWSRIGEKEGPLNPERGSGPTPRAAQPGQGSLPCDAQPLPRSRAKTAPHGDACAMFKGLRPTNLFASPHARLPYAAN